MFSVAGVTAGNTGINAFQVKVLKVADNYGVTYEEHDAAHYNSLFGVAFSVSNIKYGAGAHGSVTVDGKGNITFYDASGNITTSATATNITSFDLTAVSANCKTATTPVAVQ